MSDTITPASWHACKEGHCPCGMIWAADGNTQIGVVYGPSHAGDGCETGPEFVPRRAEQIANAKLIASAPTMAARIVELEQQLSEFLGEL